jgi:hypothetical protein
MQSSPSHNYTTMTAFLTVLKIQPWKIDTFSDNQV